MPTMCIQCAMRAIVNDEEPPSFDETAEEHMKRVHPDPGAASIERALLELELMKKFDPGTLTKD